MSRLNKGIAFLCIPFIINHFFLSGAIWLISDQTLQFLLSSVTFSVVPIGIYYIVTRERSWQRLKTYSAYQGLDDDQLRFLDNFSWAAYLASIFWAFSHHKPRWAIWYFIPIVNIYWIYKMAIDGRKMIWKSFELNSLQEKQDALEHLKKKELIIEVIMTAVFATPGIFLLIEKLS
jgi:hypothetical protein